jgi:hypothetical protein
LSEPRLAWLCSIRGFGTSNRLTGNDQDKIRKNFYAALRGEADEEVLTHTKHCLEYIRNTLMCHADTNLEYREVHPITGQIGTSGYNPTGYNVHYCRDWNKLRDFVEKWRVWNGKDRPEQRRISEEENIPGRKINYDYISSRGDPVPS